MMNFKFILFIDVGSFRNRTYYIILTTLIPVNSTSPAVSPTCQYNFCVHRHQQKRWSQMYLRCMAVRCMHGQLVHDINLNDNNVKNSYSVYLLTCNLHFNDIQNYINKQKLAETTCIISSQLHNPRTKLACIFCEKPSLRFFDTSCCQKRDFTVLSSARCICKEGLIETREGVFLFPYMVIAKSSNGIQYLCTSDAHVMASH